MTKEEISIITETAAKVAIAEYRSQQEKDKAEFADARIKSTKQLLKSYRQLKAHCEQSVYDSAQAVTSSDVIRELMNLRESTTITSLVYSAQRTQTLLSHVDKCLSIYKTQCEIYGKEADKRRWRIIDAMYLSDVKLTADELAEIEYVDVRTIHRDIGIAIETLSVLLFGAFF